MEKPSTKKPMNVLKTMVFLENFMKYELTNYFEISEQKTLIEILTFTKTISFIFNYSEEVRLRIQLIYNRCRKDVNFYTALKKLNEWITANKQ